MSKRNFKKPDIMTNKNIYQKEISRIKKVIVENYKPEKIILFGSCAFGKIKPSSDIDMLIIKKSQKRRIERIQDVLFMIDNNLPFEPLVYTPLEIKKRLALGDFFVKNILEKGKILYEKQII